jgi:subtilisin-like proprotein convertase family protein
MQSKTFWVGDRPAGTWAIQVRDQKSGEVMSLGGFTTAKVLLVDPQNKLVGYPG